MSLKRLLTTALAVSLGAAPVAAAANPAASLSVAQARAGSSTAEDSRAVGGGILAALILAGIASIVIIDAVDDDGPDSP